MSYTDHYIWMETATPIYGGLSVGLSLYTDTCIGKNPGDEGAADVIKRLAVKVGNATYYAPFLKETQVNATDRALEALTNVRLKDSSNCVYAALDIAPTLIMPYCIATSGCNSCVCIKCAYLYRSGTISQDLCIQASQYPTTNYRNVVGIPAGGVCTAGTSLGASEVWIRLRFSSYGNWTCFRLGWGTCTCCCQLPTNVW